MNISCISNTQPNFKGRIYIKNANRIVSSHGKIKRIPTSEIFLDSRNICSIEKSNIPHTKDNIYQALMSLAQEGKESAATIIRTNDKGVLEVAGNHEHWFQIKDVADDSDSSSYHCREIYFMTEDGKCGTLYPWREKPEERFFSGDFGKLDELQNAR